MNKSETLTTADLLAALPKRAAASVYAWPAQLLVSPERLEGSIVEKYLSKLYIDGNTKKPLSLGTFSRVSGIRLDSLKKFLRSGKMTERNCYKLSHCLEVSPVDLKSIMS